MSHYGIKIQGNAHIVDPGFTEKLRKLSIYYTAKQTIIWKPLRVIQR